MNVSHAYGQDTTALERIIERVTGPFHLRLIFQPLIAVILGIRDGMTDAKQNRPPYILELFRNRTNRKSNINQGIKSVLYPLIVGIILDGIVQFLIFDKLRVWGAVIAGIIIIGLPYSLSRGISNRLTRSSS